MNITQQLVTEFSVAQSQVENTLALFDEGATVPFIARYRKERTGGLDEIQIRDLQHKYDYYKELNERREAILQSITEQGKLTAELKAKIEATLSKTELEDLYLPYRPKRVTRGKKAEDAGLAPLADWLVELTEGSAELDAKAVAFVDAEKGFETPAKALQGACDILAERLADDADVRKHLREMAEREGLLVSSVRKESENQKTKFSMYYDFKEKVATLAGHRVLAMLRGEREKVLRVALEMPLDKVHAHLESRLVRHPSSAAANLLRHTAQDSFERLLSVATETEIRNQLREAAEVEAFVVFTENLRTLLLAAPAGRKAVLGVDPGFRTGCKVVALDSTGKFLEYQTIFPNEPRNDTAGAGATILRLVEQHGVVLIAIGNGTAGRETEKFIRDTTSAITQERRPVVVIVNESGASVYSASDVAIKEFPDQDITVRGAISIARRLQDPLSELVKIDPKAIGVGQYQHDVNQTRLKERLEEVVESCVNRVGVDLNLASEELLRYVSGLNRTIAGNVVRFRNEHGAFGAREDIRKVPGIGPKTFEQSAGFLRIPGSPNPLDNSSVHPERYGLVEKMAAATGATVQALIGHGERIRTINKQQFVSGDVGLPTIEDILAELEKPGRDPRAEFTYAQFSDNVREIADLKPGMKLEGTITNVTNFGAFVDIGVHQDGLVHISQLADRFVKDPREVAGVGQVVKVTVLEVDPELKRISLSMRSAPGERPPQGHRDERPRDGRPQGGGQNPRAPRPPSVEQLKQKHQKSAGPGKLFTVKPKFSINQILGR